MKNIKSAISCIIWMLATGATFSLFSNEALSYPPQDSMEKEGVFNIDGNYMDHGLVNINGNKVTTKIYSFLPEKWEHNSKRTMSKTERGVIIGNYQFWLEGNGILKARDNNSGVVKELDRKLTPWQGGNTGDYPIYTVVRGYLHGVERYALHVYANNGNVEVYSFNPTNSFTKGESKIKSTPCGHDNRWRPWNNDSKYRILSLIRIPSLLPAPNSSGFCESDFVMAICYHVNTPSKIYYQALHWLEPGSNKYDDSGLNERFVDYRPRYRCYLDCIDAISATTYIGENGKYEVLLAINCWGADKKNNTAMMKLVPFVVNYNGDQKYALERTEEADQTFLVMGETFNVGHYAVIGTWTEASNSSSERASQHVGEVSPYWGNWGSSEGFYKDTWKSEAYYDWSPKTLAKYITSPIVPDNSKIDTAAHEGVIVHGMVLGVPPHPELYKRNITSAVELANSIRTEEWNGVKTSLGNSITVEAGGCTPVVPVVASASYSWFGEESDSFRKTQSFETGSSYTIKDYDQNMIIAVKPGWEIRSAIIIGNNGYHVRYGNYPASKDKGAYLVTTAVMKPKKSGLIPITSDTTNPGKSTSGRNIVPTKGMIAYSASKTACDGTLYENYLKICKNLESLCEQNIICEISTASSFLTSNVGESKVWFNIEKGKEVSRSTTNKHSIKMTAGVKDVATISNEFTAEFVKSSGSSVSNKECSVFSYRRNGMVEDNIQAKPVMYWIPVSKLRAECPDRISKYDLRFIPDYMWNNSMDYWLMAYSDIDKIHAPGI